ncbi:MAG: hypothetical protein PSV36_19140 [Algoriphagus sp.]|nr:hypothetical protein [Algoriphagus sp.]
MNKYIDFGEIETWPDKLQRLVFDYSEKISKEKKADWENIRSGKAHYHFVAMPTYDRVKSELEEFLFQSSALAWHCTKLINPERIKTNGLMLFSVALLKETIQSDMGNILSKKDQGKIIIKIDEYERDGFFENRENQLWFLLNKEMWSDTGCREFFEFFGGEALRRVIESELPEYYPIFQRVGNPYLVEFPVQLSQIESFQRSNLADELINYGIHSTTGERNPYIEAEGNVSDSISPIDILDLIHLDKGRFERLKF